MISVRTPAALLFVVAAAACGPVVEPSPVSSSAAPLTVGGCTCPTSGNCAALTYSDIPADNRYYITTFGGGSDTQGMACGGTADGTWAYVADSARFGCGALLVISAGGKQCVAEVADCGPNRCVEEAASYSGCTSHFPIIDASPYITQHLLGMSGVGYSDKKIVTATLAPAGAKLGCPGVLPPPPPDSGPPPDTAPPPPPPPPPPDAAVPPTPDTGGPAPDHAAPAPPPDTGAGPPPAPDAGTNPITGGLAGGCQAAPGPPIPPWPALALLLVVGLARRRRRPGPDPPAGGRGGRPLGEVVRAKTPFVLY